MTDRPAAADRTGAARARAPGAVGQAPRPHDPVRDDRGSADLCAVDRQFPPELAQRPAAAAYTAALVLDAAPSGMVPEAWRAQILDSIGARAVAMKMGKQRRLLAVSDMPPTRRPGHRHARRALVPRDHRRLRHAVRQRQRRHARRRAGADGRRVRRDRPRRGAAAPGDAGAFRATSCCCRCSSPASPRRSSISRCITCSCGRCAASPPT